MDRVSDWSSRQSQKFDSDHDSPRFSRASSSSKLISPSNVSDVRKLPHVLHCRLERIGIPRAHLSDLLSSFLADICEGVISNATRSPRLDLDRFQFAPAHTHSSQRLDQIVTQLYFTWPSDPERQRRQRAQCVPQSTLDIIARLHRVADLSFPTDLFQQARAMRRKFIVALRTAEGHLAASISGLYVGPLRLLAHEIWERLNRGQTVPLGMVPEAGSEHDPATNMDVANETGSRLTVRMDARSE